jgi:beta-ureidopropionase / N-carbamoyl-L-amino-acid hydrolase
VRDFLSMWASIERVGRNPDTGGYLRFAWTDADHALREWFADQAQHRMLDLRVDRNGNQWAWWGDPEAGNALVVGSHLDSVPDGGAFDGPLGIVSAFAAVDRLRDRGVRPPRPLAVVNFVEEEGARFGVACAGSRLLTGTLKPETARCLRDSDGHTMDEALRRAGRDPAELGRDEQLIAAIGHFVELHVEQGRGLVDDDASVGVASAIWPHGRYRLEFTGAANHAGTTRMDDRRDPMLTYAMTALAANKQARLAGARATFGRLQVDPNGTNAIPSRVMAWLDARAEDQGTLAGLLSQIEGQARARAARDGTAVRLVAESVAPAVRFDTALRERLALLLGGVPVLATGAGHDAGVLSSAGIPSAMLFVRNPTGISHSPEEHAEEADCLAGVDALTTVLAALATDGQAGAG